MKVYWDSYGINAPNTGVFVHAENLSRALKEEKLAHTVVAPKGERRLIKSAKYEFFGSLLFSGKIKRNKIVQPWLAYRYLSSSKKDSFIFHGLSNCDLPFGLIGREDAKTVVTIHDLIPLIEDSGVSLAYKLQFKFLLPKIVDYVDQIVCVSKHTKDHLIKEFPRAAAKTKVIANGYPHLKDDLRTKGRSAVLRVICVGRPEKYKRLISVVGLLNRFGPSINFTVVTNDSGRKLLERFASRHIRSGSLIVHTNLATPVLESLYRNADVLFQPSLYEGFCLPAVEALSCGLPVVFIKGSGVEETVDHEGVGLGIDPAADVDEMFHALELMRAKACKPEFLADLKEYASSKNSWKDAAKDLKSVYESLT